MTYFESYWVVLNFYKQTPRKEAVAKTRMKRIQALGKTMLKEHEIQLAESLSKINYENGISYFTSHGVRGAESAEKIEIYEHAIRNFTQLIKP